VLPFMRSRCGRQPDSVTLGQWLGRHKNQIIDAMWFAQDTSPKDAIKWYVEGRTPDTAGPDDCKQGCPGC
jgi:hypothetical protein